jgi:histone acetyltransferase MYST1
MVDLTVGSRFSVRWRDGKAHPGEIVDKRPIKGLQAKGGSSSSSKGDKGDVSSMKPNELEYYIHFPGFDRRLDEWVTLDRIDTKAGPLMTSGNTSSTHKGMKIGQSTHSISSNTALEKDLKKKRKLSEGQPGDKDKEEQIIEKNAMIAKIEKEAEEITKVKNIPKIIMGKFEVNTWYYAPYPDEYYGDEMYVCEFCLKYMKERNTLVRHAAKCHARGPPGKLIYKDTTNMAMFEIDGQDHKIYCQNLCLLSKLFLDHKTLYYDVDPFMFYVLCEVTDIGYHIVGYFSKEKQSQENNLACILTFPQFQRKGYGKLLISISYELTKLEGKTGSPEKPLSDLGKISYRSYWAYVIGEALLDTYNDSKITIVEIQRLTGIKYDDVLSTLHAMGLLKAWKGQHLISVTQDFLKKQKKSKNKMRLCDVDCLTWEAPPRSRDSGKQPKLK